MTLRVLSALARRGRGPGVPRTPPPHVLLDRYGVDAKLASAITAQRARAGRRALVADRRGRGRRARRPSREAARQRPGYVLVQAWRRRGPRGGGAAGTERAALAALVASALTADRWRSPGSCRGRRRRPRPCSRRRRPSWRSRRRDGSPRRCGPWRASIASRAGSGVPGAHEDARGDRARDGSETRGAMARRRLLGAGGGARRGGRARSASAGGDVDGQGPRCRRWLGWWRRARAAARGGGGGGAVPAVRESVYRLDSS